MALLLALAAGGATASASTKAFDDESSLRSGYVPEKLLERPLPLRRDIGNSHETVTTFSGLAQNYCDQGLNYLESFFWIEAARSFHQALRLDPNLALAYVGLSRAESGLENPGAARYYENRARTFVTGPGAGFEGSANSPVKLSDRERRIVEIRGKQIAALDDPTSLTKLEAYRKAIDDALAANLGDPQLWLLRGIASESSARGRGQRGTAASIAFYERVLKLEPENASAHHYLVHSYEAIGQMDHAVEHGEIYYHHASSIPHAAHMLGHALRRAGRLDEAIILFLNSDTLERSYYKAEKIDPSLDWHHQHNLEVLRSCYEEKGQWDLAEKAARELATLGTGDADRALNGKELPDFLIHRGRYEEALRDARAMTKSKFPQSRAAGHALAGRALVGLGRHDEAGRELEVARKGLEEIPVSPSARVPRRSAVEPLVKDLEEALHKSDKGGRGREAPADSLSWQ